MVVLLLTRRASAWGGLIIGGIYALACIDARTRARVIFATILIVSALSVPLFAVEEFAKPVLDRMESVTAIKDDRSFRDPHALLRVLPGRRDERHRRGGHGRGRHRHQARLRHHPARQVRRVRQRADGDSVRDGLARYAALPAPGWGWMIGRAMKRGRAMKSNRLLAAAVGTSIALVSMLVFSNTLNAFDGILFQLGVTLPVIGHRYARMLAASGGATP